MIAQSQGRVYEWKRRRTVVGAAGTMVSSLGERSVTRGYRWAWAAIPVVSAGSARDAAGAMSKRPAGRAREEVAGYGKGIDSDGDCKFVVGAKTLTIEVPDALHDLNLEIGYFNAPKSRADFMAIVKVCAEAEGEVAQSQRHSLQRRGIPTYLRLENGGTLRKLQDEDIHPL